MLDPSKKDITGVFDGEFKDMTANTISLSDLLETREHMIELVNNSLLDNEKKFLLSFKNKTPDWQLLSLNGVNELPAVKWKLINLKKMTAEKHALAYKKLESHYSLSKSNTLDTEFID